VAGDLECLAAEKQIREVYYQGQSPAEMKICTERFQPHGFGLYGHMGPYKELLNADKSASFKRFHRRHLHQSLIFGCVASYRKFNDRIDAQKVAPQTGNHICPNIHRR
jgi:hypothetical protein